MPNTRFFSETPVLAAVRAVGSKPAFGRGMSIRVHASVVGAFLLDACGGIAVEPAQTNDAGTGGAGGQPAAPAQGGAIRRAPGSGYCGDGILNGDEACDGQDFGNESCQSATLSSRVAGTLRCTS